MSGTRSANHHHLPAAEESADQLPNRVFGRHTIDREVRGKPPVGQFGYVLDQCGDLQHRAVLLRVGSHSRSMTVPVPRPPPQHMATRAYLPPVRSSSVSALVIKIEPVAPSG